MKKATICFLVLFGAIFLVGEPAISEDPIPQLPGFTPSNTGSLAEAPVYSEGDYWVYKLEVDWVTTPISDFSDRAQSGIYRIERRDGKFVTEHPQFLDRSPVLYDPSSDHEWYRFPLKAGDIWKDRYLASKPGRKSQWRDTETKVEEEGEVVTKAGKFRVLKSVQKWRDIAVYAYSPAAKAAVAITIDRRTGGVEKFATWRYELIEYGKSQ